METTTTNTVIGTHNSMTRNRQNRMGGIVMTKQTLSIEQMQHLQELGMEMKDTMLYWIVYKVGNEKNFVTTRENAMEVIDESCGMLPAYTLQDVLDILPTEICYIAPG